MLHWDKKLFIADSLVTAPVSDALLASIFRDIDPSAVGILSRQAASRYDLIRFHVVHPEYDSSSAIRIDQDVESHAAIRL